MYSEVIKEGVVKVVVFSIGTGNGFHEDMAFGLGVGNPTRF